MRGLLSVKEAWQFIWKLLEPKVSQILNNFRFFIFNKYIIFERFYRADQSYNRKGTGRGINSKMDI